MVKIHENIMIFKNATNLIHSNPVPNFGITNSIEKAPSLYIFGIFAEIWGKK